MSDCEGEVRRKKDGGLGEKGDGGEDRKQVVKAGGEENEEDEWVDDLVESDDEGEAGNVASVYSGVIAVSGSTGRITTRESITLYLNDKADDIPPCRDTWGSESPPMDFAETQAAQGVTGTVRGLATALRHCQDIAHIKARLNFNDTTTTTSTLHILQAHSHTINSKHPHHSHQNARADYNRAGYQPSHSG
jgi:hypothetical protein